MVHGFSSTHVVWRKQIEELSSEFETVALDLRGFGDSDKPTMGYSAETFAKDLKCVIDQLGIPRIVLMGTSMGGFVVQQFYHDYPEKVSGLILISTRGKRKQDIESRVGTYDAIPYEDDLRAQIRRAFGSFADQEAYELAFTNAKKTPKDVAFQILSAWRTFDPSSWLPDIKVPTLVIVGEEDKTFLGECEYLHEKIKGSALEIIKGAGHMSMLQKPKEFNSAVREFLRYSVFN